MTRERKLLNTETMKPVKLAAHLVFVCADPEFYWWDFVFLLRRFAISLCAVALSGNPDAQAVLAASPSTPCEIRCVAVCAT
jgi:hypothetical protein